MQCLARLCCADSPVAQSRHPPYNHSRSRLRCCAAADDEPRPRSEILVTTSFREYKYLDFLASPSLFPSMTVRTASATNKHMNPSETSDADRYRSLERALANKYIQVVLARRRRLAANQGGLPEVMRPR
jgi:hypothetical protein